MQSNSDVRAALIECLSAIGAPSDGVETLHDDDIIRHKVQVSGAALKRWHSALQPSAASEDRAREETASGEGFREKLMAFAQPLVDHEGERQGWAVDIEDALAAFARETAAPVEGVGGECDVCHGSGRKKNDQLWPDYPPRCGYCDGTGKLTPPVDSSSYAGVDGAKYAALSDMLDKDIARHGSLHSFMIRAGLLREILDTLSTPPAPEETARLREVNRAISEAIARLMNEPRARNMCMASSAYTTAHAAVSGALRQALTGGDATDA